MAKFHCNTCGYSTSKATKPEKCNYCSKKGSMVEEESAEQILDEVEE